MQDLTGPRTWTRSSRRLGHSTARARVAGSWTFAKTRAATSGRFSLVLDRCSAPRWLGPRPTARRVWAGITGMAAAGAGETHRLPSHGAGAALHRDACQTPTHQWRFPSGAKRRVPAR